MFLQFLRIILRPFIKVIFPYTKTFETPQPSQGPVVLAGKHISALDAIIILLTYKRPVRFMGKAELFKNPIARSFFNALGAFPVNRGHGDLSALKESLKILHNGEVLGIMPEGHRIQSIDKIELKTGAMNLAIKGKATIIPFGFYTKDYTVKPFRKIYLRYGKPLTIDGNDRLTKDELAELTEKYLKTEIIRLSRKDYIIPEGTSKHYRRA